MQLTKSSALLTAATFTLLGIQANNVEAKGEPGSVNIDAAFLYYGEANDRIQVFETALNITKTYEQDQQLNVHLVLDTLSGASPNGATPSNEAQTFTRPSGAASGSGSTASSSSPSAVQTTTRASGRALTSATVSAPRSTSTIRELEGNDDRSDNRAETSSGSAVTSYSIGANQQPMDSSFEDTRGAVNATWSEPINRDWLYSIGGHGSLESDYSSFGVTGSISRNLFHKNTTITAGTSFSYDTVTPFGGVPVEFSRMAIEGASSFDADLKASQSGASSKTKNIADFLVGVTQIINSNTLMQFNYSYGATSGYMTDPYKIVSVIDDQSGINFGGNLKDAEGNAHYIYEKRPNSRIKQAWYWQGKHMFDGGNILNVEYRFMSDDWGVKSDTVDVRFRVKMNHDYIQPHVRWYHQNAANFYKRYLTRTDYQLGPSANKAVSADYRLGDLTGITAGLKYGTQINAQTEATMKLEYFAQTQTGDNGFGKLSSQELYPNNDAIILQLGLSF